MNFNFSDYNNREFYFPYQKLFSSVSNNYKDLDFNYEQNETATSKKMLFNNINKEDDSFHFKVWTDYIRTKNDNIPEFRAPILTLSENNISYLNNDSISLSNKEISNNIREKKKIFRIEKINKKIGRIKKNSIFKGLHNRSSEDNIIRKIKGRFIEKIRLYINTEYQKYLWQKNKNKKRNIYLLKKINPIIYRKIKKEDNLKWFNTKIYEIFSENISIRYSSYSPDSNKKKINKLLSLNEAKNIIDILNSKVEILYNKFINDEEIEAFKTLKDDIKELEHHMEINKQENIEEYLRRYEYVAKNMKNIFTQKISRHYHNYPTEKVNII